MAYSRLERPSGEDESATQSSQFALNLQRTWSSVNPLGQSSLQKMPGFFTPFESIKDFSTCATTPITCPITFGLLAGCAGMCTAIATLAAGALLLLSAAFGILGTTDENIKELAAPPLEYATYAAFFVPISALAVAAFAVVAVVLTALSLVQFVTRSISTLASPLVDCLSNCMKPDTQDEVAVTGMTPT